MPDLGWDIAEAQLQQDNKPEKVRELTETNTSQTTAPLQKMIAIVVLIVTILEHLKSCIQKIQKNNGKYSTSSKIYNLKNWS